MTETRRSNVIIVIATDTDAAKPEVTAGLARAIEALGQRVAAVKATDLGCGALTLASEDESGTIDFDELLLRIEAHAAKVDILLLEAAGGLLEPITWSWGIVDVAQALEARALVVAADREGVVNQALLTLGALELASIPVAALVLTGAADAGAHSAAIARLAGFTQIYSVVGPEGFEKVARAVVAAGVT